MHHPSRKKGGGILSLYDLDLIFMIFFQNIRENMNVTFPSKPSGMKYA